MIGPAREQRPGPCIAGPGYRSPPADHADEYPTYGHRRQSCVLPNRRRRDHLDGTLRGATLTAVPVGYRDGRPGGVRIGSDARQGWQAAALETRTAHLRRYSWWGRLVERCIQAQACDEGDGLLG